MPAPCSSGEVILAQKGIIEIDGEYLDIEKEIGIIDWSKVPVDTPVIVWDNDEPDNKERRHFAKYEDGMVCVWDYGATSWSSINKVVTSWDNARLADVDKE